MTDVIEKVNAFSVESLDVILAVLWQSTVLMMVVAIALAAWQQLAPRLCCWAWRLVAVKLLVMPFWIVTIPLPQYVSNAPTQSLAAPNAFGPHVIVGKSIAPMVEVENQDSSTATISATFAPAPHIAWQAWLVAIWLGIVAAQLVRLVLQRVALHRLLASARPADETIRRIVADGGGQLHLSKLPDIQITDVEVSPFVCRMMRPVLVLPNSMASPCNKSQLRQIVLHELAHVRRGDLLWCWVTHVARLVYWFHPVAHWVAFRESLERELACDELAMSHSGATAAEYARTLIEAASRLAQPAVRRSVAAARLDGGHPLGWSPPRAARGTQSSPGDNP
jgi:beta-lactamase regulating signal transducer with metallopeptidase domain